MGSDRAHDLIDLQIIASGSEIDYLKTKETCIRLFSYREQQAWPPVVTRNENWNDLYMAQVGGLPVIGNVDGAIAWANQLVMKIDSTK